MNWLILWAALQVGWVPNAAMVIYDPTEITLSENTFYTQLEAEARFFNEHLFIGGEVRTEIQRHDEGLSFMPQLSSYGITAGLRWAPFEFGVLHVCEHPTVPYFSFYHPIIKWEGWYTEVYIRLSGDTGGGE